MGDPEDKSFLGNNIPFEMFTSQLYGTLVSATSQANELPEEHPYSNQLGMRLLNLAHNILSHQSGRMEPAFFNIDPSIDDVSQKFQEKVGEAVDNWLEEIDHFVDETRGKTEINLVNRAEVVQIKRKDNTNSMIFHANNIARPQDKWKDEIDNSDAPFIPKIFCKPNARVPLDATIAKAREIYSSVNMSATKALGLKVGSAAGNLPKELQQYVGTGKDTDISKITRFPHPYHYELMNLEYLPEQFEKRKEQMFLPLESTPCTWVCTVSQVKDLLITLRQSKEIAIDLEHHDYRSYQGFTCLMQISTRSEDFLVDCIELRNELYVLNEIFTDPKIVKVLHGADRDIEWLQRDLGLYIVNMFDTGQAARVLDFPSFSLAHLLKQYCGVTVDKKYQLADWRIRPLPTEMAKYAQEDTHYLLYIYDRIHNEALGLSNSTANLIRSILSRSRDICLKEHEKEEALPDAYLKLYNSLNSSTLDETQLRVFAGLYEWRDQVARMEDESVRWVLPNHMMLQVALHTPTDVASLLECCQPIPPLVQMHANDLVIFIQSLVTEDYSLTPEKYVAIPKFHGTRNAYEVNDFPGHKTMNVGKKVEIQQTQITSYSFHGYGAGVNPTPSPVLTTEQLYKQAQWTDDPSQITLIPSQKAVLAKQNEDYMTDRPTTSSLLIDHEDDDDEEDESARSTYHAITRGMQKDFMPMKFKGFDSADSDGHEDTLMSQMDLDRNSSSNKDVTPMEVVHPKPKKSAKHAQEAEPVNKSDPKKGQTDSKVDDDEEDDEDEQLNQMKIPQSMAEIYQLSNETRKRKKKKKKLKRKTSPTSPGSPLYLKDGEGESKIDVRAQKRLLDLTETNGKNNKKQRKN
eukprot:TRINITY_DN3769_c0_g1_i1.p1 TRINITY_DN3769_c0_g1~~TRINITY_DN3769_c0_g1_i1.p1  ORF type:complete len:857 (+),score=204.72 TRINITY_DN3769_c0_g1_i1:2168-4738(+)